MARCPGGGERHATVIVKQHGDGAGSHEMRKMVIKDSDIDGTIASALPRPMARLPRRWARPR